jgi:hypothetical protein
MTLLEGKMGLHKETVSLWEKNATQFEKRILEWVERIEKSSQIIKGAKKTFQKWKPLRFYTSFSKAKGINTVEFSVRFYGQEVAQLRAYQNGSTKLVIDEDRAKNNSKYFQFDLKKGMYEWKDKEAALFRKHFKQLAQNPLKDIKPRVSEHKVESIIIEEMEKNSKTKFGGAFSGIQPVTIEGFPFQMPLPISASSGKPLSTDGNIDILARRRCSDGKVRLSVWELKKPKTFAKAIDQVYIYTIGLIQLLRSSSGQRWFKIFGFNGPIPKKLEIEAVVLVSSDQLKKMESTFNAFRKSTPLNFNGDTIKFSAAYYNENNYFIESFNELI